MELHVKGDRKEGVKAIKWLRICTKNGFSFLFGDTRKC